MDLGWSTVGAEDCLRVHGLAADATVRVRPSAANRLGPTASMTGRLVREGDDLCFVPRYPFVAGTAYTVEVDGHPAAELIRTRPARPSTTEVAAIYPSAATVPRNLLRCYVWFTAAMSEGYAAGHLRLVDDAGEVLTGALLPTEYELWDPRHRRLTVLLDPARIKRGLAPHRAAGYPLRSGTSIRLVVDPGFVDAAGSPLRGGAEHRYTVDGDERRPVEPDRWVVTAPPAGTGLAVGVAFDRSLDHGLLARCLRVTGPDGRPVAGRVVIGPGELTWQLTPDRPWSAGRHDIVVAPILEDVAGNSVRRVFDRELSDVDHTAGPSEPVRLAFEASAPAGPGPRHPLAWPPPHP